MKGRMSAVIHYIKDIAQLLLNSDNTDTSSRIDFTEMWCMPLITANNHLANTRLRQIFQEHYRKAAIALDSRPESLTILSREYPGKEETSKMMIVDTSTKQRIPCHAHPDGLSMDDFTEISELISLVAESIRKKNISQTVILPIVFRMVLILPMKEETLKGIVDSMNKNRKKDKVTLLSQI